MPDIIQVAEQLKDMPDQWLAQQMQQPSGTAPPWLVASEVARRQRMRSGATKAQAPQSSVSQDLINSLFARIPPTAGLMPQTQGAPTPPGMPPVNLSPGSNPSTLGAAPGGTPPGNFKMPARMAAGGQFDDSDDDQPDDTPDVYSMPLQNPSRRAQLDQLMMPPVQEAPAEPQPATMPQAAPVPVAPPPAMPSGPVGSADRMAPDTSSKDEIARLVDDAAQRHQLPSELIGAVLKRESNGVPTAVSPKGAIGLMQIMPATGAQILGVKDPAQAAQMLLDPAVNIDTGAAYLKKLLVQYNGDTRKALMAYNMGPGAVERNGGVPYRSTDAYITNINRDINASRAKLNLPPVDAAQTTNYGSRFLGPQPQQPDEPMTPSTTTVPAGAAEDTTAMATATATATATPSTDVPATPSSASSAAAAPARPIIPPAMERPAELRELDAQYQRASDDLAKTLASVTPYDPRTTTSQQAIQGYKDRIRTFIGPEPDNSKFQQSFQDLTAMAQKLLHPSIGSMLMNWGLHMMASKQHNFGVAMGEAGLAAQADYESKQAQGRGLWIQALDLGLKLQDRTNNYNTKVGELAMQEQRLDQSAGTAQYTQQFNLAKEKRLELQQIAKDRAKAQTDFDKTVAASPTGRLAQLNQYRQSTGQPPVDMQNASPSELQYYEFGTKPSAGTAKAPPIPEQLMESAVRDAAKAAGFQLPPGPVALSTLPQELQAKARDLYNQYAAGKTIATQTGTADAATKNLDPEFIGAYMAQNGHPPPGMSRNPLMVARVMNMGIDWMKAHGYSAQSAILQQNMAAANKAALPGLTKLYNGVEAFSKATELNMQLLETTLDKIPDYGAPAMNMPLREIATRWQGDKNLAGFHAVLKSVQNEVGKVLSSATAAGAITESEKADIQKILGDDATPEMIRSVLGYWRQEMANRKTAYGSEVQDLARRSVFGHTGVSEAPAGGGGQYRNLHKQGNITIGVGSDNKWHNVATGELYQ